MEPGDAKGLDDAYELLRQLEWRFPYVDEHRDNLHLACPVCGRLDKYGHKEDCKLDAWLRTYEKSLGTLPLPGDLKARTSTQTKQE
jgi:hypothetical protein